MTDALRRSTMRTSSGKNRPLNIPQATMDFLMILTEPAQLRHTAEHADFIKNAVLADLRLKIITCDARGGY